MQISDYDYTLPPELIAQTPVEPRDQSRLLVVHRSSGLIEHRSFNHLGEYLDPGDILVANESKVLPARLPGRKLTTGGKIEVLLLRPVPQPEDEGGEPGTWEALVSPGRRIQEGTILAFGEDSSEAYLEAEVMARSELGGRIIRFNKPPRSLLSALGEMPLPPYIHERLHDPNRYQTVYARVEGSAAAPTAGLHFTERLIKELQQSGVGFTTVVLHVGLDTFRPIHEENVDEHPMHKEWFQVPPEAAEAITRARSNGGRVVAVGTTSVRVLETVGQEQSLSLAERQQPLTPDEGWSQLYIKPGYKFRLVDMMITNFHLPRTTLLLLVSAFANRELIIAAYDEAIREQYRFYSFGDAMLII